MNLEVPSWAWGLIVAALFAGPAVLTRIAGYWFGRIEARLDELSLAIRAAEAGLEERIARAELRLTIIETRAEARGEPYAHHPADRGPNGA